MRKTESERNLWLRTGITLAVGDGANDVPMIQGAHVGIGGMLYESFISWQKQ